MLISGNKGLTPPLIWICFSIYHTLIKFDMGYLVSKGSLKIDPISHVMSVVYGGYTTLSQG